MSLKDRSTISRTQANGTMTLTGIVLVANVLQLWVDYYFESSRALRSVKWNQTKSKERAKVATIYLILAVATILHKLRRWASDARCCANWYWHVCWRVVFLARILRVFYVFFNKCFSRR